MSSFGTAFLQTTADAANKRFADKTAEENKVKDEQRKMYWGIAYDTTGQYNDAQKSAALEQYNKLVPASLRKPSQKFNQIFGTLSKAAQAHTASQDGQQPPAAGAQPSPNGKLPGPSTPPPAQSSATLGMPPGGGAMTTQPPAQVSGQPATPKPSPAATPAMSGPKTPAPQTQKPPQQQAQGGVPIMTDADIAKRQQVAQQATKDAEIFKTDEQIRAKTAEDKAAAEKVDQERTARLKAIDDDEKLSPEEKKQGRLDVYGIKMPPPEAMTSVHYLDKDGEWKAALHDPRGNLFTLDHKAIAPSDIKDVRPEPPAELKPTGELAQREEAQKIIDDPKATAGDKKAATATLKNLDKKAEAVVIRVNDAAQKIKDAGDIPPEEIAKWKNTALGVATRGLNPPAFGMAQSKDRRAYNAAFRQVMDDLGPEQVALDRAAFKAGSASLTQLQRTKGQIGALEDAFDADLDNAREASKAVPRTSMKKFNSVAQLFKSDWTDDPALAQLSVAAQTAVNQYAKVAISTTGQSTDTARAEAMSILDKAMAKGTFDAALDQMQKEAHNRMKGIDNQIDKQKNSMISPKSQKELTAPLPGSSDSTVQKLLDKYK